VHGLGFGLRVAAANVHGEAEFAKHPIEVTCAFLQILLTLEHGAAVVCIKWDPKEEADSVRGGDSAAKDPAVVDPKEAGFAKAPVRLRRLNAALHHADEFGGRFTWSLRQASHDRYVARLLADVDPHAKRVGVFGAVGRWWEGADEAYELGRKAKFEQANGQQLAVARVVGLNQVHEEHPGV
jgi:hypothetical protein